MAIQDTQVPMYTNTHCCCIFLIFQFFYLFWKQNKIKTKQPNKNGQTTWKQERKMHMYEGMIERVQMHESIPKTDKKSSKKNLTLDRKN